jgi:hypothetical protein
VAASIGEPASFPVAAAGGSPPLHADAWLISSSAKEAKDREANWEVRIAAR